MQRDIKLKNCQIYDDNGDPILGTLEGNFVLRMTYTDVNRLQKGPLQTIDDWYVEVSLTISSINAALKYYCADQLTRGRTPTLPMLIGESLDKETGDAERVRITDIVLNPEELTLWAANASGTENATYQIRGRSNKKPDFLDKLPEYEE